MRPLDAIPFLPALYSIDANGVVSPSTLQYSYYCILADVDTVQPNNFNQPLYLIQPNIPLTQEQIHAPDTCFKSSSKTNFKMKI